ncbi:LysE family translocator [Candidatus Pelagibacter bacterium]|jgi:threonine/homoserine/homoserine lactone efflux protein|nr:LysE family translocator [Candidatus Pelagibacter bacterium]
MHPELFLLIGISLSLGFTPGPNNAVASFSGFNFGIKKTIPSILGVWLGYTALVILVNFVLISTFLKYPTIQEVIRLLGTFFLLYLAYKISFSTPAKEGEKINPVRFIDTFVFQFLNPKGVMAAITLISNFVIEDDYINSSLTVIVVCSLTALTSITTWAFFGKFLRNFATNNNFIKRFNYVMSLLLIVCIIGFYI